MPVGWDTAENALRTKRWDRLVSLYEQPLKEQPGNVFIVSLHGSLNPVHWDHIRMFEAGKKIIEKKVGDQLSLERLGSGEMRGFYFHFQVYFHLYLHFHFY